MSTFLLVAAEFPPCGGGGVGRPYALAKYLAEQGHKVVVITASENNYTIRNSTYVLDVANMSVVRVYSPNIKPWIWRAKKVFGSHYWFDQYYFWKINALRAALSFLRNGKFDTVISTYPSDSNHYVAHVLHKYWKVPWVADFRDPPPRMNSAEIKRNRKLDKYIRSANRITVTTSHALALFENTYGHDVRARLRVIENGCDDYATEIEESVDSGSFQITHTGSFYQDGRDVNQLIQAVSEISHPVQLQFIGDMPYEDTVALVEALELRSSVSFKEYMASNDALVVAARSNALVVVQGQRFENQVPGKIYDYLALQKPVLVVTNKGSATELTVRGEPNVVVAEYGNIDSIRQAIRKIVAKKVQVIDRRQYSKQIMCSRFEEVLKSIV